ncbi:MAG TPA: hypothetical protein VIV66_05565 [Pyrinomonadaceae bacterium]
MGRPKRTQTRLYWLGAVLLSIASAAVVFWQNGRLAVLWDLSYILENSYRISLGEMPYRDFPFPYAPLTFLTQATLIKLTGRVFFHHVIYCAAMCAAATLMTWRILLKMLSEIPGSRPLALILTAPLTALGIYAVFPHPFYDPDCTFAVLLALLLLISWTEASVPSPQRSFLTGAVLVIPLFVKQNTGLGFILSAGMVLLLIDILERQLRAKYIWLLAGLIISFGSLIMLIHLTAGLNNYIRWTVKFAAERRAPAVGDMIGVYLDPLLKWWLAVFLIGLGGWWISRGRKVASVLSLFVMAAPFTWPVVYLLLDIDASERAERLVGLWPLLLIISFVIIVIDLVRKRVNEIVVPVIVLGTVHAAFLSQQLWGSTYALWPFFVILLTGVIRFLIHLARIEFPLSASRDTLPPGVPWIMAFAIILSLSLLISGFFYIRSHERLDYANLDDGELTHSKLRPLQGLVMRGTWIPSFEELIEFSDKEIPYNDGILCLPGEDLFYYTTGRHPQFPVLLFDHTVNPFSPQAIVDLARSRNIQWLIVKDELQMEEEPLEQKAELMKLLLQDFESVESLDNYEIYKRKTPNSDNDESDDGADEEESQKP